MEVDDTPLQSHFPLKKEVGIEMKSTINENVCLKRENRGRRYSFTFTPFIEKGGRN